RPARSCIRRWMQPVASWRSMVIPPTMRVSDMPTPKHIIPSVADLFGAVRVIPVLTVRDADHAVPLARALAGGGLPVLEITLRTDAALESIRRIAQDVREAVVGAGTVTGLDEFAA